MPVFQVRFWHSLLLWVQAAAPCPVWVRRAALVPSTRLPTRLTPTWISAFWSISHLAVVFLTKLQALGALVAASVGPWASSDALALVMVLTKGRANCTGIRRVMSRAGARLCTGLTRGAAAPLEQPNPGTKEEIIFKNLCSLCREGPLGGRAPRLPPPPGVTGCD